MFRTRKLAVAVVTTAAAFAPAAQVAHASTTAENAISVYCGATPGGGYIYNAKTLDSSPARKGPYEACSTVRTYSAGATVGLACWLYNDYDNLWYKTSSNTYIYGGHFSSTTKSKVDSCEG